jgi:hypothetical protein
MAFQDVGQGVVDVEGFPNQRIVAGSGAAGVDLFGPLTDRQDYLSLIESLNVVGSLAATQSVTVDFGIQHTTDSTGATGWVDFAPGIGLGEATSTGGTTTTPTVFPPGQPSGTAPYAIAEGSGVTFPSPANANRARVSLANGGLLASAAELNSNIQAANRYIRAVIRATFTAGTVDFVDVSGIFTLGEARTGPR